MPYCAPGCASCSNAKPDFSVCGEAADGRAALDALAATEAEVVVLDVAMPGLNVIEAAAQLSRRQPGLAILMLSMHNDETYVLQCLRAGARGYVLKESAEAELIAAIRAAHSGRTFFSPKVQTALRSDHVARLRRSGADDRWDLLTEREREIFQLAGEGRANKEIAARLNLSTHTVETHRKNIAGKLELHGTAETILYAMRCGIVG